MPNEFTHREMDTLIYGITHRLENYRMTAEAHCELRTLHAKLLRLKATILPDPPAEVMVCP